MELINAKVAESSRKQPKVAESFHLSPPGDAESRNDEYCFRKKTPANEKYEIE